MCKQAQKSGHKDRLIKLSWCRHTDSNRGPTDYKSVALPTVLCRLRAKLYSKGFFFSNIL